LVTDQSVRGPALHVTDLVEIVAVKPAPFLVAPQMKPGMLFSHDGGFYIWSVPMLGTGAGFMCITHGTSPKKNGENIQGLPVERLGIALSTDVRRRPVDSG
jgi:hypothetical protein